jgi:hypothetical protein
MWKIVNKQEILRWSEKYYTDKEDHTDPTCEKELGDKLRASGELTKQEFMRLLEWKFSSRPGRLKREKSLANKMQESVIRETIKQALSMDGEDARIRKLLDLKGVGNAVASVILTFYDPKNYGVFDIHVYDEMFGTNPKTRPKDMSKNPERYIRLLQTLRQMATECGLDARTVEKALFKKNVG